jgi:hypothetical protein
MVCADEVDLNDAADQISNVEGLAGTVQVMICVN